MKRIAIFNAVVCGVLAITYVDADVSAWVADVGVIITAGVASIMGYLSRKYEE